MDSNRIIVALSGGIASAYCAKMAFDKYPKEKIVLYFNDTKWEHPDLYRFLNELVKYFNHSILYDSDGRSVEQLFFDNNALANNFMPFCSRILKAERLQKYCENNDKLIFGISYNELHRAERIISVYDQVSKKTHKSIKCEFPLITENITKKMIIEYFDSINIEIPLLYKLGFEHNNCSGGCVRAGKKQWKHLLDVLPDVYSERERVEKEMQIFTGKNVHFLKDITLEELRKQIEQQPKIQFPLDDVTSECIGICSMMN